KLKELRELNQMTQVELARKLGVSDKTISSWEINRTEPKMGMVQAIADIFNVKTDDLIKDLQGTISIFPINVRTAMEIPIFRNIPASCGFGSWADDEVVDYISLPTSIYKFNKHKKYFGQIAEGDSMINAGIEDGDILVFESYNNPEDNMIGVFTLYNNTCYCKRFKKVDNKYYLVSANENYLPIEITPDMDFRMVGLLKYVVKEYEWGV
ncbi:MAG: helix-turn-helix domain-containing protein, partial [Erysipelotrichaceae bacterium]|nr:helix-turn-helix domain-containing protein [Erysipelotrichaceae bacterium]